MRKKITRRFVLHVGYSCNERCVFCYYRDSLEKGTVKDHSTSNIKKKLRIGRRYGKTRVDLSGGEPTIRKDLFEIIRYARKIGYEKVGIITNGLVMSNKEYCKQLIEAGLNDCLFSLHAPESKLHDHLTSIKGSWNKLIQAMDNMRELNADFRINTVITNLNFDKMDSYFKLLKKYDPAQINLLVFNPSEETCRYRDDDATVEDYGVIGDSLKRRLDAHGNDFKVINVRFLPFCLLRGQEKRIRTMWQKIYEKAEWDPFLFMRFRKNNLQAAFALAIGLFLGPFMMPRYGKRSLYTRFCEIVQITRIFHNKKHTKGCRKCSLRRICPGLHRAYVKKFNKTKVLPYPGKIIHDPLHLVGDTEDMFEG
jgi:MoaA/NifB/PqqE/SkfB family radical SAM enzyme